VGGCGPGTDVRIAVDPAGATAAIALALHGRPIGGSSTPGATAPATGPFGPATPPGGEVLGGPRPGQVPRGRDGRRCPALQRLAVLLTVEACASACPGSPSPPPPRLSTPHRRRRCRLPAACRSDARVSQTRCMPTAEPVEAAAVAAAIATAAESTQWRQLCAGVPPPMPQPRQTPARRPTLRPASLPRQKAVSCQEAPALVGAPSCSSSPPGAAALLWLPSRLHLPTTTSTLTPSRPATAAARTAVTARMTLEQSAQRQRFRRPQASL